MGAHTALGLGAEPGWAGPEVHDWGCLGETHLQILGD